MFHALLGKVGSVFPEVPHLGGVRRALGGLTEALWCTTHLQSPSWWSSEKDLSCYSSVLFFCPLYFRVRTFPKESHLGHDTVRALMYYALKVWSDITPLNFHEVAGNNADIQIDFSKADHNDGYPFDGPGGTVAHAFFPGDHHTAGDTHFDDDEYWTFRSSGRSGRESCSQKQGLPVSLFCSGG